MKRASPSAAFARIQRNARRRAARLVRDLAGVLGRAGPLDELRLARRELWTLRSLLFGVDVREVEALDADLARIEGAVDRAIDAIFAATTARIRERHAAGAIPDA